MTKFELYLESGEKASLEDVCNWWIKTYPADVLVNKPELVVEIRGCLKHLLRMMHAPGFYKPSLSQNNKKEDGFPPTPKGMGIQPTIL